MVKAREKLCQGNALIKGQNTDLVGNQARNVRGNDTVLPIIVADNTICRRQS